MIFEKLVLKNLVPILTLRSVGLIKDTWFFSYCFCENLKSILMFFNYIVKYVQNKKISQEEIST